MSFIYFLYQELIKWLIVFTDLITEIDNCSWYNEPKMGEIMEAID